MTTVLIALDQSAAARPVLEVGAALSRMAGATADGLHVREGGSPGPVALADRFHVPLRTVDGPVEDRLLAALGRDEVIAGVVGARATPGGRRPVGRTALHLLEHAAKPIVVVPPDAGPRPASMHRLLLPLEGARPSSRAVIEHLLPLVADDVELVALHVLGADGPPPILDHARWDLDLWKDEFLARHCPAAARVRVHAGPVGDGVADACRSEEPDLVVLSWAQDASPDRAAVVRDVLSHSRTPVLLLPEARDGRVVPGADEDAR
jgi:hypothetical protein